MALYQAATKVERLKVNAKSMGIQTLLLSKRGGGGRGMLNVSADVYHASAAAMW